jgi:hypothetical protein
VSLSSRYKFTFLLLTFLIAAVALIAHAQSSACTNYYVAGVAASSGYGAAYDLFSTQHELLVWVDCTGGSPVLKVGGGLSDEYVYDRGYLYSNGWQSIALTGQNLVSNAWYPAAASSALTGISTSSWTYVVGYVCTWNGSAWLCGCADTACATNYWQLQAFQSSSAASAGGGGGSSNGGSTGSGAGGQWGGSPEADAIVIAPSGSDSNPCTVTSPCQTLEKAQQVARSATDKTVYLRAGTYSGQSVNLSSSDNGETWMTYPGDAVDSAILDGGDSISVIFNITGGSSNITINGIKMQNYTGAAVDSGGGGGQARNSHIIVTNSEFTSTYSGTGLFGSTGTGAVLFENTDHGTITNNYMHDLTGGGITMYSYYPGESVDGTVVDRNVVLNTLKNNNDSGAIYMENNPGANQNSGHMSITNNFVRDYGNPSGGGYGQTGIYLDEGSGCCGGGVTISGNIIGPPAVGSVSNGRSYAATDTQCDACGATWTNNIIDLGTSNSTILQTEYAAGGYSPPGITASHGNIILRNFAGNSNSNHSGQYGAYVPQGDGANPNDYSSGNIQISNNVYYNYGGGQNPSNGPVSSDSNPIVEDPQISGYLYTIAQGSPVFNSPVSFQSIQGGWSPPGSVIPSSSNHSDP